MSETLIQVTLSTGNKAVYRVLPKHLPQEGIADSVNWPIRYGTQVAHELDGVWYMPSSWDEITDPSKLNVINNPTRSPKMPNTKFPAGQWAIVTATEEARGDHDCEYNVLRNIALLETLDGAYDVDVLNGTYNGVDQGPSFLVHGISEKDALELAAEFNQESILTSDGLVYVDGRPNTPRDTSRDVFGPDAEKEEFFSTFLASGESFSLGLNWS